MIGYMLQMTAFSTFNSLPWLHRVSQPTLVLSGEQDRLMPVANSAVLASHLPNARLRVFEHWGHYLLHDSDVRCRRHCGRLPRAPRLPAQCGVARGPDGDRAGRSRTHPGHATERASGPGNQRSRPPVVSEAGRDGVTWPEPTHPPGGVPSTVSRSGSARPSSPRPRPPTSRPRSCSCVAATRAIERPIEDAASWGLHLVGLPSRADMRDLKKQLGDVQREMLALRRDLVSADESKRKPR